MSDRSLCSQNKRGLSSDSSPDPSLPEHASGVPAKSSRIAAPPKLVTAPAVQQAVTSLSIELGEGASPIPHDALLLLGSAKLLHLKVTLVVTSGDGARSITEQNISCNAQKDSLLTSIGAALTSISHLHLIIEHRPQPQNVPALAQAKASKHASPPPPVLVPEDLAAMANSILATLAPAVPRLQRLSLGGCISQKTLVAFSPVFAQLRGVQFEALCVPIEAVQYLCPRLPNLAYFTLMTQKADRGSLGQDLLKKYVFEAFKAVHNCRLLTRLDMAMAGNTWLYVSPETWDLLPDSLREFQCTFPITFSHRGHVESLRKVRRLVLSGFTYNGLDQMTCQFPYMEQLSILGNSEVSMECYADKSPDDIKSLRGIFDRGLVLKCSSLKIEGKCRSLRDLLEVMPPLPSTVYVTLGLRGRRPHDFCLADMARVFPNLKRLTLMDDESLCMATPMTSEKFVAPLLKCASIERLQLSVQLDFTTASLEKLCLGMPRLSFLFYFPWKGVDDGKLKARVQTKRSGFELMPCVGHGYYAHPAGAPSMYV